MKLGCEIRINRPTIAAFLGCMVLAAIGAQAKPPESATAGTLDGKLTDWHSIPLAEAVVVVRNLATGATIRGVTGKNGNYRFTNLNPGEYRLEAELPSLGKGAVEGILVSAGHATRVQAALMMELPASSAQIEAGVHQLDPVAAAITTLISSEELSAIPISARNWQEFAAITPAANPAAQGESSGGQIGQQPDAEDHPQPETLSMEAGSAFQTASSMDGLETTPAFRTENTRQSRQTESVGESAVLNMQARTANAPAEAGRSPGGAILLTTAQGRNGLHGQAFYLNKQSLWGAQNPFTQSIQQTAPASGIETAQFTTGPYTPANTRQTVGLGAGSQLKRDKLFWFAALDGLLTNDPAVATVRHPSDFFAQPTLDDLNMLAARIGPSALQNSSTCPSSGLQQAAVEEQAAACYSGFLNQMAGLLGPVPRTSKQWQGFGRIDWQSERNHLSAEANAASEDAPGGALTRSSETYGSHSFGNSDATDTWALAKLDSFLTPNLLNDLATLYRRDVQRETPQAPSTFEAPLLAAAGPQLPEIVADSRNGFILGKPARLSSSNNPDERGLVAQDTLSWVHGSHLVKAGLSFDHLFDAVGTLDNQTGTYSYPNVLNFVSDLASYQQYGISAVGTVVNAPNSNYNANCDVTGRVYQIPDGGGLGGRGYLPCYAWFSQRVGPSVWHVSTNDLAAFATEQWQPAHNLTLSAGIRVETEQLPPTIAAVNNPDLPATQKLPANSLNWGPRFGLAYSPWKSTVLRLGAGLYYGRIDNAVLLAALTQTGSPNGDLNLFVKPTDPNAPPFPTIFSQTSNPVVTPGAVSFAPHFRPQQVDQAIFSLEQQLPSHWLLTVNAMASLGRRLPISIDTNIAPAVTAAGTPQIITYTVNDPSHLGPIKAPQITVPFYTERPPCMPLPCNTYQQLASIEDRANSTYEATLIKIVRYGGHGLNLRAHYLYAHATDWNPNESGQVAVNDVLDPNDFHLEYGTSNLDIRHSAAATILYEPQWKLHNWAGVVADNWNVAAVGQYRSGLPFTMRTGGYIPGYYTTGITGNHALLEGIATGINGSGGDNRIYGAGSDNISYNIGRNTFRYPATWTADTRLGKRFYFRNHRELELLAESFNLFNHQNVTLLETTGYILDRGSPSGELPTLNFLTGLTKAGLPSTLPEFGKPLDVNATNFYHPREIQLGLRARF
jgi:Carboxypeptidase regulatory-like domain